MRVESDSARGPNRLIDEVGAALEHSSDVDGVLRDSVAAMADGMADVAVLAHEGRDGALRFEIAHHDPPRVAPLRCALEGGAHELRRLAQQESRRGRRFRWLPSVTNHAVRFARAHPVFGDILDAFAIHSLVVVPLRARGRAVGAVALGRVGTERPFSAADLAVVQVIGRRIALKLESLGLQEPDGGAEERQARLHQALRKWTGVFDLATWGAAVVDGQDRRLEAVNPAFARMHGYDRVEELTGRLYDDLVAPERHDDLSSWGNSASTGITYESLHLRSDGVRVPVLVSLTPLEAPEEPDSYVVTLQDLTDLKRAENRLQRAQRMEAVGRLAGGVAHEVNNMMTIVLGFSDLLARAAELPEILQRDVEEIRKAASRAGRITQQLLAYSRQQVLQPTDLNLNGVVDELAPVLRLLLPVNIRLETVAAPVDTRVRADRAQLEQVLINLAFNARDAMSAGGVIRIVSELRDLGEQDGRALIGIPIPPGPYALLHVVDTGHGMDAITLAQVFEPFFTTKPVGAGTGLGLATVYGIVKQSGGFVWVESTPDQGTTFTVALPKVADAASSRAAALLPARRPGAGGLVLVVEDEDGVRELAGRLLQAQGYQVLKARTGSEALALAGGRQGELDLVLTDVVIPDLPIGDLERRLRALQPNLPMLFMSGYARDEVLARNLLGADAPFLQKPFTGEELLENVGRALVRTEVVGR